MKRRYIKTISIALISTLLLTACGENESQKNSKIEENNTEQENNKENEFKAQFSFNGSSTLAPVISKISTDFIEEYKSWNNVSSNMPEENISIYVSAGGSGAGVKSVLDGTSDFGMLARELKDEEKEKLKDLKEYKLGIDALTISVNPKNPLIELKNNNLTKEEIVKIFSGEYKKWSELDSSLPDQEIVVVTRDLSGGAHQVFQKKIMGDTEVSDSAIQAPSMGALVTKIIENPNAIGYASFGMVNQNKEKLVPLDVDGIKPTEENIVNGDYIISRPLIAIKSGEETESEQKFLDYLQSDEGREIIKEMGFVPIK